MKIVALLGSPRINGNTAILMEEVLKGAKAAGAETQSFVLNDLDISWCQGCFACKVKPYCIVTDDGNTIIEAITNADGIIFATPIYMWDMTAQLKTIIDRFTCLLNPDFTSKLLPGKKVLWTVTQGQSDIDLFSDVFVRHEKMLQFLGFGENKLLIAGGLHRPGDIENRADIMGKARELGGWLAAKK